MTPERWQQIERLYHDALELAPEYRLAFLDRACAGDDELRREIESLLASHDDAGTLEHKISFKADLHGVCSLAVNSQIHVYFATPGQDSR